MLLALLVGTRASTLLVIHQSQGRHGKGPQSRYMLVGTYLHTRYHHCWSAVLVLMQRPCVVASRRQQTTHCIPRLLRRIGHNGPRRVPNAIF